MSRDVARQFTRVHTHTHAHVLSTYSLNNERMFNFTHHKKNADYKGIWQTLTALLVRTQGGRAKLENWGHRAVSEASAL